MKAVVTYDSAGTVETIEIKGPYIRMQQKDKDSPLWVKVYKKRNGKQLRCWFCTTAYSVDLVM